MEINRNQYFMIGLVLLMLGLQLRWVDTYVLNEQSSRFLAERIAPVVAEVEGNPRPYMPAVGATPRRSVKPPRLLGFALISVGSVLILHSLAMKRPGG